MSSSAESVLFVSDEVNLELDVLLLLRIFFHYYMKNKAAEAALRFYFFNVITTLR